MNKFKQAKEDFLIGWSRHKEHFLSFKKEEKIKLSLLFGTLAGAAIVSNIYLYASRDIVGGLIGTALIASGTLSLAERTRQTGKKYRLQNMEPK